MEEILQKLNDLIDEFSQTLASTDNPEEQEKVIKDYEEKIRKEEESVEKRVEEFLNQEDEALAAEQAAALEEIKRLEQEGDGENEDPPKEDESDTGSPTLQEVYYTKIRDHYLRGFEADYVAKKMREKEIILAGEYAGFLWDTKGTKLEKVKLLYEYFAETQK